MENRELPKPQPTEDGIAKAAKVLLQKWRLLAASFVAASALSYAGTFLIKPTFVATTTFIPPQQQGGTAAALASLGALSSLIGGGAIKTTADQHVALMRSVTVSDHLIDQFDLMQEYDEDFRQDARKVLGKRVQINIGKKDGVISVDVEDHSPQRAAQMANQYVQELRQMTSKLLLGEAQQRRASLEKQFAATRDHLVQAQTALQQSGFNASAIKAEPKSTAEAYAKLRADLTMARVKLQVLQTSLADSAPEVKSQRSTIEALAGQVSQLEAQGNAKVTPESADYISRYREFKYQETLFDLVAKQYEIARMDEARDNTFIQVIDEAAPPEKRYFPKRSVFTAVGALLGLAGAAAYVLLRRRGTS